MNAKNCVGVWLDHSVAHLLELQGESVITKNIESEFTAQQRSHFLGKNENLMHHVEQQQHAKYYKEIAAALKDYKEILLFGPTHAKNELMNLLKADHHFEKVKLDVKDADKMTENQQHAFVIKHFQRVM